MRTLWLEPAEDWGGHGHDDLEISNTLGLRVKRWYRGFAIRDKPWEARINIVGSKITLRKLVLVFTTTIMVYYFVYLAIPCTGARRKVNNLAPKSLKRFRPDVL
jgi:hypothetical protein